MSNTGQHRRESALAMRNFRRLISLSTTTFALAALGACGPAGEIGGTSVHATHAVPLEGARNDALRAAADRRAVPVELLYVIAHHQGRFELPPPIEEETTQDAIDPMTDDTGAGADPLAEPEADPTAEDVAPDALL